MSANPGSTVEEIEPIVEKGVSDAFMGLVSGFHLHLLYC